MGLYRGHSNTKCASFSTTLQEQKWHSLVSLEIGLVDHHPISMVNLWFKVQKMAMILHCGGVNVASRTIHIYIWENP